MHHLGEIAGGVIRAQHGEFRAGGRRHSLHAPAQSSAVQRVDFDGHRLARTHREGLGFLVVGDDPELFRHQVEQLRAGRDILPLTHGNLAYPAVARRLDGGVVQVDPGPFQRGLGDFHLRLQAPARNLAGLQGLFGNGDSGLALLHFRPGRARGGTNLVALADRHRAAFGQLVDASFIGQRPLQFGFYGRQFGAT